MRKKNKKNSRSDLPCILPTQTLPSAPRTAASPGPEPSQCQNHGEWFAFTGRESVSIASIFEVSSGAEREENNEPPRQFSFYQTQTKKKFSLNQDGRGCEYRL